MQFSTIFRPNLSIHTCPDLIRSFLPLSGHCRLLHAGQGQLSVYQDSYLKALDRKKRLRSLKSKEFETLGTWDRLMKMLLLRQGTWFLIMISQ